MRLSISTSKSDGTELSLSGSQSDEHCYKFVVCLRRAFIDLGQCSVFCVLSQPTKLQKKQALLSLQHSLVSDEQESKSISVSESEGKSRDLVVACHTPPLKKQSNKGECHYPASVPSHLLSVQFGNGMVLRMGSRISPCF